MAASKNKSSKDIFKDAQFWFAKGHILLTLGSLKSQDEESEEVKIENKESVALDYYLSGVKIEPTHLGCIHNVGCCHFFLGNFANAEKWFNLAIQVDPQHKDSYIGKTVSCLKLGLY